MVKIIVMVKVIIVHGIVVLKGPTDDVPVNKFRNCQKRNFLTTLFLSQGIPMLVAGW